MLGERHYTGSLQASIASIALKYLKITQKGCMLSAEIYTPLLQLCYRYYEHI